MNRSVHYSFYRTARRGQDLRALRPGCTSAFVGSTTGEESSIGEPGDSVVECGPGAFWRTDSRPGRSQPMEGATATLKEKLDQLLQAAAAVSVALDRAEGTIVGVPHYAVIEARAHQLGQELSRRIQAQQMGELTAGAAASAKCP